MNKKNILAISGSLRHHSMNTALLRTFESRAASLHFQFADIGSIPHYNAEEDGETRPTAAQAFIDAIEEADALLIATPEYNYSIPGVLKNAIDWASRPAYRSVFRNKPVGIVSAAASVVGGARAQEHLRQVLFGVLANVFAYPEFLVGGAHRKFDNGVLKDEVTMKFVDEYLEAFADSLGT